ncbi:PWWP domain-containing protein 3 isoform X1 [Ricinus communis]|uniref:PWWP domain-containing protein 3 isoform X1 n=2 Tax=Ricinus communis TaxID=3988 RepID=UPI00201B0A23|nr:PWWP domain-containing protein 3 isoform X1 [Ricinus communis]
MLWVDCWICTVRKMKEVDAPPKSKPESPNLSQTSPVKSTKENGVRVSVNGNEGSSDLDGGGVITGIQDTVHLSGNEDGLEDSEMNGVSSLLQMQGSKSLHGLGSVLDIIYNNEKMGCDSSDGDGEGDGVSLVADICGDVNVNPSDVKEKRPVRRGLRSESSGGNEDYSDGEIDREVEEDSGDEGHDFGVGDFVWGKIRSHPWWPGRIYDPSDASDFAKKVKQKDKILVAYFGDGTFAWCNPSQLKPLDDNFVEMSKQSNSKNFVNAVEKAMDEVGRLVDLKMTCTCVPKENLIGFGRTLAVNAGVKEGLLVPEGGINKLSSALFEPTQFLSSLRSAAQVGTVTNILETTVLNRWLSAFHCANGGHQLPSYYDPKPILGLEDDSRNWAVDLSNYSSGMEVRIQGPTEEDWLSSPRKNDQTTASMLKKCQGVSEDGLYQRRKQKSLAEILEGQADAELEKKDDVLNEEGTMSSRSTSLTKRKKRKCVGENTRAEDKIEVVDATDGVSLAKPASSSGRKRRRVSGEADAEVKNKMEDVTKAGDKTGKPPASSGGKKRKGTDEAHVDNDGSSNLLSKPKTREESKLSESLAEGNSKVSTLDADASRMKQESVKTPLSRARKEKGSSHAKDAGSIGGKDEEMRENTVSPKKVIGGPSDNGKAEEQIQKGALLRERKRSKYLSPPYTNLNKVAKKNEVEAESVKVSSEAQLAEPLTKAASHVIGSPPILKPSGEKFQKRTPKVPGVVHETSDGSGPQTPKQDQNKIIDPMIIKAPANEVLSKMRSAALNPLYLKETNSVDVVGEFVSAFRNSSYCNMTDSEYSELHSGRKRKSQKSEPGSLVKEQNRIDQSSPDQKSHQTKTKKNKAKVDKPKVKQAASARDMKTKNKEPNGETPGAALYVTFGPGSSLPTKNDLIQIYRKYGALNENETEMFYANYCARVLFLKTSEAEEAFNDSQLSSPFKAANVTFRLRYLSAETKTRELRDIPSKKRASLAKEGAKTPGAPSASQSSGGNLSELNFIKQKLEMITSLLETSIGKISPNTKSILEGEIKVLLEKVSSMVGSSS